MIRLIPAIVLFFLLISCSSDDPAPVPPSPPGNLQIFDIDNAGNASDFRVFFNLNSIDNIAELRIILVKNGSFSLGDAESLISDSYHLITPVSGMNRVNLVAQLIDSNGDPISNGTAYQFYVLLVTGPNLAENVMSVGSEQLILENKPLFDLYVSSRDAGSVELFDGVTGEHIRSFVQPGSAGLSRTQEVLFGLDGHLYVSGRDNRFIKKYDGQTGAFIENFTSGYDLDEPTKMKYGPDGHLYVSQWGQVKDAVVRFDTTTGAFIDEVVPSYFQGMDQTWDGNGNLYVTSWGLADVRKYDSNGNFLETLINSNLTGPVNLWNSGEDLFVVDWTEGNVKIFDINTGVFKSTFISGFNRIEGFDFDPDGNIYLCDWQDNIIRKFDGNGTFLQILVQDAKLGTPNSVKLGPNHRPE